MLAPEGGVVEKRYHCEASVVEGAFRLSSKLKSSFLQIVVRQAPGLLQ